MKYKILLIAAALFAFTTARAQINGGGYNPDNPGDPNEPDTTHKYNLSLMVEPSGAGSFNMNSGMYMEGTNLELYAYTNGDYTFKELVVGDSVIANNRVTLSMPSHDLTIKAKYFYNPSNPENPNKNYWDKQTGEVIVDDFTPGYLSSAISSVISGSSSNYVNMITVSGRMNSNDFGIANNYSNCILLDLSRVTGVTEVPSYAFDYTNLETVYLPATIEKIGSRAFAECSKLSSLTIYAMTPPTLESDVFQGIPDGLVVYVPAAAISQYQKTNTWKDFTLLPIQEDIRSLTVNLPEGTSVGKYTGLWLEITNTRSGQRIHYVLTDKNTYSFRNLIKNTTWNVTLRNQRGNVFGSIENVDVNDKDTTVTFASLSLPQTVKLVVILPDGTDVTSQVIARWTDTSGNYMAQGSELSELAEGDGLLCTIALPQSLAMAYQTPEAFNHTVTNGNNTVTCALTAIPKVTLQGKVLDATTGLAISGVTVSASQTFAEKYSRTQTVNTANDGSWSLNTSSVPTNIAFASSEYISQTITCDSLMDGRTSATLPNVLLRTITGALVNISMAYTLCPDDGEETAETQNWYSDYENVEYTVYNKTQQKSITQFSVQYPRIVLLEEVADGDELNITAKSKNNAFMPVETTTTIKDQSADITFNIVQLGRISAKFAKNENASVNGSLYNTNGKLIKSYEYSNGLLNIDNLQDGKYTLVTMAGSQYLNTIGDLSRYAEAGLTTSDYALNTVDVVSGQVSHIVIEEVPTLDESRFFYTGNGTSFTVNKSSIVVGNYLTFTGKVDFKPAYASSVGNVSLIVDIPENCSFVENSVMVGNSTSSYTLNGQRLTIPMECYSDRVRFCVIPTIGGSCNISALVSFDIDEMIHIQPVGTAYAAIKDIAISAPSVINTPLIIVRGNAKSGSNINVFWDNKLSGTCKSNRVGDWQCQITFDSLSSFSEHTLCAQIEISDDLSLFTESKYVTFDEECPVINKVTMINAAHPSGSLNLCEYVTTFDFTNSETPGTYWYWPSYPKFTFIASIDSGKGNKITDVTIYALTEQEKKIPLRATYDSTLNSWIATENFYSGNLPVNVGVTYHYTTDDISIERFISAVSMNEADNIYENSEYADIQVSDDGKTFTFLYDSSTDAGLYLNKVFTDGGKVSADFTDDGVKNHLEISFTGTNSIPNGINEYRINQDNAFYMSTGNSGLTSKGAIYYPVNMIDNMRGVNAGDWSYTQFFDAIRQYANGATYVFFSYEIISESVKPTSSKGPLEDAEANCPYLTPIIDRLRHREEHTERMNNNLNRFIGIAGHVGDFLDAIGLGEVSDPINVANRSVRFGQQAGNYIKRLADRNDWAELHSSGCLPPNCDPDHCNPNENGDYVMDPSGYVYEAVPSNRLEGVTATIFYKENVEDMYGDIHENIVKWDAEEYAQENPLFTDENGMYRWDVPEGLWQVKFEKEGYETAYSEWLPVPPPQLDVNIGMKQNAQPNVVSARAYEDAVEMEFDKYMIPEFLTTEQIKVFVDDTTSVEGTITLSDMETDDVGSGESYARKVRFTATKPFTTKEVTLSVSNRVRSYAGIRMQDDYSQAFTVEQEVHSINCDSLKLIAYGDTVTCLVSVTPAPASAGKTLRVSSSSPMIATVLEDAVTLDENGEAEITICGLLPGVTGIMLSVDNTNVSAIMMVNVRLLNQMIVATPIANIASGSEVKPGTEITLTCTTEGANIWYTLDGSCPCDESGTRIMYDGNPIVINDATTIKAMATAKDMYDSDVATFTYTVETSGIKSASARRSNSETVYSITGTVIRRNATSADISRLPKGIYIVEGKKIIVK